MGSVAVLDRWTPGLRLFEPGGAYRSSVDLGEIWCAREDPLGRVAAHPDGGFILWGRSRVVRLASGGTVTDDIEMRFPDGVPLSVYAVRVAPDGTIWTCDGNSLYRLDERGVVDRDLLTPVEPACLGEPCGVRMDAEGSIYAMDRCTRSVHVFDASGRRKHVCVLATEDAPHDSRLATFCVSADGEVFIHSKEPSQYAHFDGDGRPLGVVAFDGSHA